MRTIHFVLVCTVIALTSTNSMAGGVAVGLTPYNQDFEGLDASGLIIGDGWEFFANVYEDDAFLFGYGPFDAPNGPQISALVTDQGGPSQGGQQLVIFSDYNCCAAPVFPPGSPPSGHQSPSGLGLVQTSVFQTQLIDGADVGENWTFSFDAKRGNIEGSSLAYGFIGILDPSSGFSLTELITIETTAISIEWNRYSVDVNIDDWAGQILQFGFLTSAANYEGSGIFYDNVDFSQAPVPLPGALLFLGSGLLGVAAWRHKPI